MKKKKNEADLSQDRKINKYIEKTAVAVVAELKKQNMMNKNKFTPFQKTENLLYNYNNFLAAIKDKGDQIKAIQAAGLPKKSKSITVFSGSTSMNTDSEIERIEDKLEALRSSILLTRKFIEIIDAALDKIKDDPYFEIIDLKYFKGCSREDIADYFEVDVSTITRNKNRLIDTLKIILFSDEVILELFS